MNIAPNWFEFFAGKDGAGVPSHIEILKTARRRRVFSTDRQPLIAKCQALKEAGMLKGGSDHMSETHNFRLTEKGHQCLKT